MKPPLLLEQGGFFLRDQMSSSNIAVHASIATPFFPFMQSITQRRYQD